jgi:transposase
MSGVSEEQVAQLQAVIADLRQTITDKDTELARIVTDKDTQLARAMDAIRLLTLRIADLERRLGMGSDDSGTPSSKEGPAAKARRKAHRRERGTSSRERSADRSHGGQSGHTGKGLTRNLDPDERLRLPAPSQCRSCGAGLGGDQDAGMSWAQIWDVEVKRICTEYLLPRRRCSCGTTTTACPEGGQVNAISYGAFLNAAAILLTTFGNVPVERSANLIGMLFGQNVSPGFVDRANERLAKILTDSGFEQLIMTLLLDEDVLVADESPVEVIAPAVDSQGQVIPGCPHVMVIRTDAERLFWLYPLSSRRHDEVIDRLRTFTGHLVVDGYEAYQKLLGEDACLCAVQQCCQHVIRRCRQVAKLGPGGVQSWATRIIEVLREAHQVVQDALARGLTALDEQVLTDLRGRYDKAVEHGTVHNKHRDWDTGHHPGYALAAWLHKYAEQVWHFTGNFQVPWTSNAAERGVKPAKRHQAVSGYWQTPQTLARWCSITSYLTTVRNHAMTDRDAITCALTGHIWLPPTLPT